MIKNLLTKSPIALGSILPFDGEKYDSVSKDTKTAKLMLANPPVDSGETGAQRLYVMFSIDEFGRMSSELNAIYQAGFLGLFTGALYGGFVHSRVAYMDFMERNEATAFESTFDAKRKLQDRVTVGFAKGAFKFGWRLALFTTTYVGITTSISVYRGKSSILEYLSAGGITGALYKFNMGLRGMTAGGLVGLAFGGVAGAISLAILKATGTTMEEVRFWQYKWRESRYEAINDGLKKNSEEPDVLLENHNKRFGESNLDLKILDEK